ncbi:transposase [Micromonospora sp. CA-240977]|uniref:transposase n=1 Tax=Micromonospora sp. CA-240977 TaxID=3239957 RepID=UPI003D8A0224
MTATLNHQTGEGRLRRRKLPLSWSGQRRCSACRWRGTDRLLEQLTKTVLETAWNEEMTEHLGYAEHEADGAGSGNIRNGSRSKTVLTGASGPVRNRRAPGPGGMLEPQIVRMRHRRRSVNQGEARERASDSRIL